MCDKKRIKAHRIETDSILIFQDSLPKNYEKDFLFSKIYDDYGIDGYIKVFENNINTGEIYHVQIKGKENFNFKISMKLNDIEFLRNKSEELIVLIIVDTKNKIVYWYDIQTNDVLRECLEKAKKLNQKYITIKIDNSKNLPQNFNIFYDYLKSLREIRIKEGFIEIIENQPITKSISNLSNISKKATAINGYKWKFDNEISKDTVLSLYDQEEGALLNLDAENDLNEDNIIKVNLKFNFPRTEEGLNKKEEIDSFFKGLIDKVIIENEFLEDSVIGTKDKIIHQFDKNEKNLVELHTVKNYKKIILSIAELNIEILFDVETWYSNLDGLLKIESAFYSKNVFKIKMNINPLTGKGNIKLRIDESYLTNFSTLLQFVNIMTTDYNFDLFLIENNLKIKIGNWTNIKNNDISYNSIKTIVEKIIFIQNKVKTFFKYKDLSQEDLRNIDMLYNLISLGTIQLDINVWIDTDFEVKEGNIFKAGANSFNLLGKNIDFKNNPIEIFGKINKIISKELVKDKIYHYECNIPEAIIKLINSLI